MSADDGGAGHAAISLKFGVSDKRGPVRLPNVETPSQQGDGGMAATRDWNPSMDFCRTEEHKKEKAICTH